MWAEAAICRKVTTEELFSFQIAASAFHPAPLQLSFRVLRQQGEKSFYSL
jgi:hypothetical protein